MKSLHHLRLLPACVFLLLTGFEASAQDDPFADTAPAKSPDDNDISVKIRVGANTSAESVEKLLEAIGKAGVTSVEIEGGAGKPGVLADHPVLKKLNSVVIPAIEFVDTPLEDALAFIRLRAGEIDDDPDPVRRGINLVTLSPSPGRTVTAELHDIRLGDALAVMARLTQQRVSVTGNSVILSPEKQDLMPNAIPLPDPDPVVVASTKKKLRSIIIPSIEFRNTPLQDGIDFMRVRSRELDDSSSDPREKGVDIVYNRPAPGANQTTNPGISLTLRNIPLGDALQFAAELADAKVEVLGKVVLISPK